RAKSLVSDIGWHVQQLRQHGLSHLGSDELDRLADAIVSVEYFMETVRKGRRDPDYMLDNAASCLESLSKQPPAAGDVADEVPAEYTDSVPVLKAISADPSVEVPALADVVDSPEPELELSLESEPTQAPEPANLAAGTGPEAFALIDALDQPVLLDGRTQSDPELLELFIEEAKEEISNLDRQLPRWRANVEQRERLLSIRRSYHTLKGSGRMVGARIVADFCWTIESLLNALIDGALPASEELHTLLGEAQAALPELVEQLEVGTPPASDINAMVARAGALRDGRAVEAPAGQDVAAAAEPEPSEPGAIELDPVLLDIFRNESNGHLKTIEEFVEHGRDSGVSQPVPENLHRAWHTLRGSANMANVQPIVALATPLNEHLRTVMHDGALLDQSALDVIADASSAIRGVVDGINSGKAPADPSELLARIDALVGEPLAPATAQDPAPAQSEDDLGGFDPEVAAIFADEAEELLAACDPAVDRWLADAPADALSELLRHLHTLKGGARMAGVASMATLSHELESVFESLNVGELTIN
ncbi:MAG: Hpt domain-containing protein, partial [Pseudomonadota bacterium]